MEFNFVSTSNRQQYHEFARSNIRTLQVYAKPDRFLYYDDLALPLWFKDFKARHANNPEAHGMGTGKYKFRRDCVRFAHKVAALTHAGLEQRDGLLVWVDADVYADKPIPDGFIRGLLPPTYYMAWLDRVNTYPECGFMIFDCEHPVHKTFMQSLRAVYETDEVFNLKETHDSFVIQWLVNVMVTGGLMRQPASLSGAARNQHHPFVACELGKYMDHCKGNRKLKGVSPERVRR